MPKFDAHRRGGGGCHRIPRENELTFNKNVKKHKRVTLLEMLLKNFGPQYVFGKSWIRFLPRFLKACASTGFREG
jgi:hypothetical protein